MNWRMVGQTSGGFVLYGNLGFATVWGQRFLVQENRFWEHSTFEIDSNQSTSARRLKTTIG